MDGRRVGAGLIYHVIGESIPPRGLEIIFRYLIDLLNGKPEEPTKSMENELPFLFESKPARAYQNS
jgi:hypothetical protein